jgi:hypothetical protein
MEHHTDNDSGLLGWAIFAISFIGSFLEPLTDGLKFIAALTAAIIGIVKIIEWRKESDYKKRKKGGI